MRHLIIKLFIYIYFIFFVYTRFDTIKFDLFKSVVLNFLYIKVNHEKEDNSENILYNVYRITSKKKIVLSIFKKGDRVATRVPHRTRIEFFSPPPLPPKLVFSLLLSTAADDIEIK